MLEKIMKSLDILSMQFDVPTTSRHITLKLPPFEYMELSYDLEKTFTKKLNENEELFLGGIGFLTVSISRDSDFEVKLVSK